MRRVGAWSDPLSALPPFRQPFGMDAMPFVHWLQGVLLPRLDDVARGKSTMPPSSQLAAHAVREFDGDDRMAPLIDVLREIDALCPPAAPSPVAPRPGIRGLIGLAHVLTVIGIVVGLWVSQRADRTLAHRFPGHVSHVYHGSLAPSDGFSPLRLSVVDEVGDDGTLRDRQVDITLFARRAPLQPIVPGPSAAPAVLPVRGRVDAASLARWIGRSGATDPAARDAAAAEIARIDAIVASARTRADIDAIASRLPLGLPEPQVVDIDGHVPQGLSIGIAIAAGLLCVLPLLAVVAARIRRQRRGG